MAIGQRQLPYRLLAEILPYHLPLRSFHSTSIPTSKRFISGLKEILHQAWHPLCNPACSRRKDCKRKGHYHPLRQPCPFKERTVLGWIMNWKVNPCLPICPLYARRCNFRKFSYAVKWNAEYRKSGQMDRMLDIYDAITFYPLGDEHWRQWTPAMVYEILASSVQYINCCGLLVQRFIRMANEELDKTLLDEMGLITGELARFKKSLADGDKVVLHNVAYLLYMIELGKLRMSKLNKLTFRDKSGAVRMHPLVNDIQKLIKDAVSIMDAQGWTTAGERRLKGVENKDKRGAALDLIEGRDYVVEDGPAALPEKVMGIAEKLIEMDSEEIEALDHEKEEPRGGKPLPESVRQRIEGETKTIWED